MEFKRINKDTITCIITEDDMDEQGIKLEDLFEKKKEAMDFLHEVMRKAEEEGIVDMWTDFMTAFRDEIERSV